jgi:hypothetical protein
MKENILLLSYQILLDILMSFIFKSISIVSFILWNFIILPKLTTHLHLVLKIRMPGAVSLLLQ